MEVKHKISGEIMIEQPTTFGEFKLPGPDCVLPLGLKERVVEAKAEPTSVMLRMCGDRGELGGEWGRGHRS